MKYLITILIISFSFSQECEGGRYEEEIFDNIYITSGVYYGTGIQEGLFGDSDEDLYLDVIHIDKWYHFSLYFLDGASILLKSIIALII